MKFKKGDVVIDQVRNKEFRVVSCEICDSCDNPHPIIRLADSEGAEIEDYETEDLKLIKKAKIRSVVL